MTIALATCRALPVLDLDDQLLHRALKAARVDTEVVVWDDPAVDWGRYALVVIRSTWDYVPRREAYLAWAEQVASQTILLNSPALLRWNTDKAYLRELEAAGLPVVPTLWAKTGTPMAQIQLPEDSLWDELVVKPSVSASGNDTHRVSRGDWQAGMEALQLLLAQRDVMIQPFMPTVQTVGEYAFLFFNGQFSHAVLKRPKAGEFRVQEHYGGHNQQVLPTSIQLVFASNVLASLPESTLYARVDAIEDADGQLLVSEVEVTEPSMYLALDEQAATRFAGAVQERLRLMYPV